MDRVVIISRTAQNVDRRLDSLIRRVENLLEPVFFRGEHSSSARSSIFRGIRISSIVFIRIRILRILP